MSGGAAPAVSRSLSVCQMRGRELAESLIRHQKFSSIQALTLRELAARLHRPVDITPLVYFRVLFGTIMLWEVCRYFYHGWIARYFIRPPYHPSYFGFEWVKPLTGPGMYIVFAALHAGLFVLQLTLFAQPAFVVGAPGMEPLFMVLGCILLVLIVAILVWYFVLLAQTRGTIARGLARPGY